MRNTLNRELTHFKPHLSLSAPQEWLSYGLLHLNSSMVGMQAPGLMQEETRGRKVTEDTTNNSSSMSCFLSDIYLDESWKIEINSYCCQKDCSSFTYLAHLLL